MSKLSKDLMSWDIPVTHERVHNLCHEVMDLEMSLTFAKSNLSLLEQENTLLRLQLVESEQKDAKTDYKRSCIKSV